MTSSVHLKLGSVAGESTDGAHEGEIDIQNWRWDVANLGSVDSGGGSGTGKAQFGEMLLTHSFDKASPLLWKSCATLEAFDEGTLTASKSGKGSQDYLIIKMKHVIVTSCEAIGEGSGPTSEVFKLQFASVDLEYKPQKDDQSLDAGVSFKYDIKKDKEA